MKRQALIGAAALGLLVAFVAAAYHASALTIALEAETGAHGTMTGDESLGRERHLAQVRSHDLCYALGYAVKPDGQC
jgi:hypothetical protein